MSVNTLCRFSVVIACTFLAGCGGMSSSPSSSSGANATDSSAALPESAGNASSSDFIRSGDKIDIRLTGVPDPTTEGYFITVQVPASGDISVPLIKGHAFHATGKTTSDLAEEIMEAYKANKIYTTPVITIIQEERFVSVGGDVRMPQRVPYTADMTLLGAINACGGFTEYAKRGSVRILRGQQVIQVDANAAARSAGSDPIVRPGDQVYVPRTMF